MTIVPFGADIFFDLAGSYNNCPAAFVFIQDKIFDANFRLFVDMVGNVRKAFIDRSLLLLVQFLTACGQTGGFSYGIIVADPSGKWSKLCCTVVQGHPLASWRNVVW